MSTLTMCSYGSFFNKTNSPSVNNIHSILPGELAEALEETHCVENKKKTTEDVMLLDCRSFLAYNFKHISGAFNVNCTGIGKKRLQQGKATLVDLVTSECGKELLKNGKWVKAVIYDECTSELEKLPASHPLRIIIMSIIKQGKEACLLKGGLKEFSECYQNLLAVHTTTTEGDHCNDNVSTAIERINCLAKYEEELQQPNCNPLNVKATEVLPRVYLGNASDACDQQLLEENGIRYILNLTCTCPNYFSSRDGFHYKQVKIEDSCREDLKTILPSAIQFIEQALQDKSAVLIHCQGGVSRSPSVTIAYLMHTQCLSLKQAYEVVKEKRPCIAPNLNFMGQLLELEKQVTATTTSSPAVLEDILHK